MSRPPATRPVAAPAGRIARCFEALAAAGRGGLITFITAGDPNPEVSFEILSGLPDAGADVIEIGMPFSDPMADGPAIQAAGQRALKAGMTLARTLEMVERFRRDNTATPIVLMGYYNPIYRYGVDRFVADASRIGVDGLIIVDLPPEEDAELCHPALAAGLNWIRLVTPTTTDERLRVVLANASGFVYYVSIAGITGTGSASEAAITAAVGRIRSHTSLPIAVGFGVRTPAQVACTARAANAAVVGSALIDTLSTKLNTDGTAQPELATAVLDDVRRLAGAIRG